MRTLTSIVLCALAANVLLGAAPAAVAEDADPAVAFYDKGREGLGARAADALWKAAESARKLGLHGFAAEAAESALTFDPAHKKARKHLGFVKKRGGWELDPDEAAKVLRDNEQPDRMSAPAFAERKRKWRDEELGAAHAAIGRLLAALGDDCAAKGFDVEARRAREEALRLDPDCAKARAALGYARVGEAWLTAAQKAAREAASRPERFEERSHLDDVLGATLTKVRSANVRAESVFGAERTESLVSALETTYTYYLTDAGRDPNEKVLAGPVKACFLADEAQWTKWLEDQAPARAAFFRGLHYYRSSAAMLLAVREQPAVGSGVSALMEDNAVHAMTHLLNDVVWKLHRHAWLDEGLTYYYTLKVRGSTESWCVEPDHSRYGTQAGADSEEKATEAIWRHHMKELVRAGDDMDLRMLTARPLNELKLSETIKGWCVATWLMETDRDGALRLLASLGAAASGAAALEAHFGKSVEDVDTDWRAWVLRTF